MLQGIKMTSFKPHYELNSASADLFDFCLWPYPEQKNSTNKYKSISLLFNSFQTAKLSDQSIHFVHHIRKRIGQNKTVWGVKNVNGTLSWELYFYDYDRLERKTSIERLLKTVQPFFHCPLRIDESNPYFMFSFDFDEMLLRRARELDEINIYIGNPSTAVSSGLCYRLNQYNLELTNLYYFFNRKEHWEDIISKTLCSAHLCLNKLSISDLLRPELVDCETIVVANKKHADGLYFSRLNLEQFITFLKKCNYPLQIIQFIEQNRTKLDHMLYDVGIDYKMINGKLAITKSAYYGFF